MVMILQQTLREDCRLPEVAKGGRAVLQRQTVTREGDACAASSRHQMLVAMKGDLAKIVRDRYSVRLIVSIIMMTFSGSGQLANLPTW